MRPIVEHQAAKSKLFLHRHLRVLPLVCLLAGCLFVPGSFAQPASAPKKPAPAAKPGNRFLFIVDTSSSMEKHRDEELNVVDEILRSNANGQLHQGDSIGVWTFNTEVYTGNMPLQVWLPDERKEIALRVEEFIREQAFLKKSRFEVALSGMYQVIQNSDIITVFIISNGDGKMQGSPFDNEINALYQQNVKEMKHNRTPVVTVLQAKGGKILKYTVNAVPWPVIVPELPVVLKAETDLPPASVAAKPAPPKPAPVVPPPAPKPAPSVIASVPVPPPTNLPPIVTTIPNPAPAVPTPVVQPESLPVTQSSPAPPMINPPLPGMPVTAAIRRPRAVPESTETPGSPVPPNIPGAALPVAPKSEVSTPPPVVPPVAMAAPTMPAAKVVPADTAPAPASATQPAKSFADRMLALVSPESGGKKQYLLIGGVALLVLGLGLILLLVRRSRRPPERISLISHVMDDRRE